MPSVLFRVVRTAARFTAIFVAIGSVTFVDFSILKVNSATAAFTFLLLVLVLATRVGLRESVAASFISTLAYNFFFLPPIGALTIADPQNWIALFAFSATAVISSQLSASAWEKAKEAGERQQELKCMYNFSRALMLGDREQTFLSYATRQIAEIFQLDNVCIYHSATDVLTRSTISESAIQDSPLRQVAHTGVTWHNAEKAVLIVPIRLGGHSLGSLGVTERTHLSEIALQSIAQLIAIAWERMRAEEAANRLEATRQNEQLKSTLLDALAHEFKTPLTSIKIAATTLLSRRFQQEECEFLSVINEEADRMTSLVNDAIELARIGSGPVALNRNACETASFIKSVLSELAVLLDTRDVQICVGDGLPPLDIDKKLGELVLRQILNNTCKYSPPGSPIRITAEFLSETKMVLLRVANQGPGIPKSEQPFLFEKFYRGKDVRTRVAGTGMGLSISREIIEAHGGRIWVESEVDQGVEFLLTLPVAGISNAHSYPEPQRSIA